MGFKITMKQVKITPGTVVYEDTTEGQPPRIKSLYIAKWALKGTPQKITVEVNEVE